MQNSIQHELLKLQKQIQEHVWHPQNTLVGSLFRYGSASLFGLLVVLFIICFPQQEGKTFSYILFTLAIVLSSFLGNYRTGFLLTGFATSVILGHYYIFSTRSFFTIVELAGFICTGAVISFLIPIAKRFKLIADFTKREKALKQQIEHLIVEKIQAEKEIRIREEFISIASHELKTPLTTTLLKLQKALHNVRNVALADFSVQNLLDMLESSEVQTKRLAKMINDLLNVSIIRTGRLDLELEECSVDEVTKDVLLRFEEKAEKEGIKLNLDAPKKIVAMCDKVRLEQVIANLISNAMKYGNGNPIDVKVSNSGNTVKIHIKDHGIGIAKDQQEKIFNLFERAVGDTQYKGLGIGLYISHQIIKAHNGKIKVESKPNKGAEFIVEFPVH